MNRICPICCALEKKKIYEQCFNNKDISLTKKYEVVVCGDCGFVFADKIPSQEDFNEYYAVMSKYEFNYKDGLVSNDYIKHFSKIVDFICPYIKKEAKILDIGCATGGLLSIFKLKGYKNLLGIDPSPSCVKAVKKLYGISAKVNNIANFKTKEKFDLIILSAVLEHLVDFKNSLKKIRSLLNDGGLLFINVPDIERFDSFITAPFQQFSIEHINYFSKISLKNLLTTFSFEEINTKQINSTINQSVDPDIFNLSKKVKDNKSKIIKDTISELKINDYVNKCLEFDEDIKQRIKNQLKDKEKMIVWGVGTHTQRLIGCGFLDLKKVLYFVDSNQRYLDKKLNGKEIKSPTSIREKVPILISSYSYQKEIADQIRNKLNFDNEIIEIY